MHTRCRFFSTPSGPLLYRASDGTAWEQIQAPWDIAVFTETEEIPEDATELPIPEVSDGLWRDVEVFVERTIMPDQWAYLFPKKSPNGNFTVGTLVGGGRSHEDILSSIREEMGDVPLSELKFGKVTRRLASQGLTDVEARGRLHTHFWIFDVHDSEEWWDVVTGWAQ